MTRTVVNARRPARRLVRLGLERLEDRTVPATVYWDGGGGDFNWNNPVNWHTNALPGPSDVAVVSIALSNITITHSGGTTAVDTLYCPANLVMTGGTLSVSSKNSYVGGDFTLAGGTLAGPGDFRVSGTFSWTGGTQSGPGKTYIYDRMTIGGLVVADSRTIVAPEPGDEVIWTSGTIFGNPLNTSGYSLTIEGPFTISGSGDKHFNGVRVSMNGPTTWTGSGGLMLDNGAKFDNAVGAVFDAQNGRSLGASLAPAGRFNNFGTFRKSVGTGTTDVGAGGLEFSNLGTLDIQTGTLAVTGGGHLGLSGGTAVLGAGELRVNGGTLGVNVSLTLPTLRVDSGTLSVNSQLTAPGLKLTGGTLDGAGDLVIPPSSSLEWTGGTLGGSGQTVIGAGASLTIPSGTPTYGGRRIDLTAAGAAVHWTGGTLTGSPWTLAGPLTMDGAADKRLRNMVLTLTGPTTWNGTGDLRLDDGAVFVNGPGAVFTARNHGSLFTQTGQPGTFLNQGTFRKTSIVSGATTVGAGGLVFDNKGILDVQTGTFQIDGGSLVLRLGATVTPGSRLRVNGGTLTVGTPLTLPGLRVESGTLDIAARLIAPGLELAGGAVTGAAELRVPDVLTWTGGTLGGTGQTVLGTGASLTIPSGKCIYGGRPIDLTAAGAAVTWSGGTLTGSPWHLFGRLYLSGGADKILLDTALNTYGYTTWADAGNLVLDDGAVFTNQVGAGFDVQTDRTVLTARGLPGTFVNAGSFRKFSAGTTTIGPGALVFANTGTVDVQAGVLAADYYTQTAGSTIVRGTLRPVGFVDVRGGALSGTGTVDGPVTSAGQVLPGLSPGVLTIAGNFTQTGPGGPTFEINGPTADTFYDQLRVTGTVTLGGTLGVTVGYPSAVGDTYVLIDNNGVDAVVGTFTGLAEGSVLTVGGRPYRVSYAGGTGNDVTLTRLATPTVQSVVVNDGSAQRSMVTGLTVTFTAQVALGPGTFVVTPAAGGPAVPVGVATAVVGGVTVATVTFPGAAGGSVADGDWVLRTVAAQVADAATGAGMAADRTDSFHRLYGDVTGDRSVNGLDFGVFRSAFGTSAGDPAYLAALDFDGDGAVNGLDFAQFRIRFGLSI